MKKKRRANQKRDVKAVLAGNVVDLMSLRDVF